MAKIEQRLQALGLVLEQGYAAARLTADAHARSAVGMAELPFGIPVEVEGEALLVDGT